MKNCLKLFVLVLLNVALLACSTNNIPRYSDAAALYEEEAVADFDSSQETKIAPPSGEKLIRSYSLSLTVKQQLDSAAATVSQLTEAAGGFVESSGRGYLSLRVPAEQAPALLDQVAQLGRVEERSSFTQDLSATYTDLAARIASLEALRQRYMTLLERSDTVTDLLAVERELARVNLELDQLKGASRDINERVAYSSITVSLREKTKLGPLGYVFNALYQGIKWLFVRG